MFWNCFWEIFSNKNRTPKNSWTRAVGKSCRVWQSFEWISKSQSWRTRMFTDNGGLRLRLNFHFLISVAWRLCCESHKLIKRSTTLALPQPQSNKWERGWEQTFDPRQQTATFRNLFELHSWVNSFHRVFTMTSPLPLTHKWFCF